MMKPIKHPSRRPVAAYAVRGFSLIEFLVASILSMIVLIAVGSGYFAARQLSDTALARLNVQQDLRNASNLIVRDARMAGSFGCFNMSAYDVAAVNETEIDEAAFRLVEPGQNSLVPVKSLSAADFSPTGFTVGSNALVFQYGVGSASIVSQDTTNTVLQIPAGDPLQTATNNTPLVFTSCAVLDHPAAYGITVEPVNPKDVSEGFDITIDNINPALSTEQVTNEFAVLRYTVNAYVIGTAGTQQGLFRFQLDDSGQWGNPQLLMPAITAMNVQYGYVNNCAASGAASDATAVETFEFTDVLKTGNDADGEGVPPPALIRITLNGSNNVAAQTATGAAAGDVYVYNIDATVRGGNTCADRTI